MLNRLSLLLILLSACGGKLTGEQDAAPAQDSAPPPPTSDATPPPPLPATDAAPTDCNDLQPLGHVIDVQQIASDPPPIASGGGFIANGYYELDAITIYTGPNGSSGTVGTADGLLSVTSAKNGWLFDVVAVSGNQAPERSSSQVTTTAPGQLQIVELCPSTSSQTTAAIYAFDGTTLTLRVDAGGETADEKLVLVTK